MNSKLLCNRKKNKVWLWSAVNHWKGGILAWVLGDAPAWASPVRARSAQTFQSLWFILRGWQCFWYVTDGYPVYPCFINDAEHLVSKNYMTRVEGENSRAAALLSTTTP